MIYRHGEFEILQEKAYQQRCGINDLSLKVLFRALSDGDLLYEGGEMSRRLISVRDAELRALTMDGFL